MLRDGASFRDPSGFVYSRDGMLYRQVNHVYADEFEACTASGLYEKLWREQLLVPHERVDKRLAADEDAYDVIRPERIRFISYPYEWCFGQLRDAALLTLDVQSRALEHGFTLRDSSAYNVQFNGSRPVFIDTLSFARYREGEPWVAYKQFCEHFLLPLLLVATKDVRCSAMLRDFIDGIPLELGTKLLGRRSWVSIDTLLHVHLHARFQRKHAEADVVAVVGRRRMSKATFIALVNGLRRAVEGLKWTPHGTQWADYVGATNYTAEGEASKRMLVRRFLGDAGAKTVWDLGANTGVYSRCAREIAEFVVAFDIDAAAVEQNYRKVREDGEQGVLPLVMDLTNPSPGLGWAHAERMSLLQRGPADALLALALVHHLAIGGNIPLAGIAQYFASIGRGLIVEFVEKSDSQVRRLLRNRTDVFAHYSQEGFEAAFKRHFTIDDRAQVAGAERWLYRMTAKEPVGR